MRRLFNAHPDQMKRQWPDDDLIERTVEERVAERFEAESFRWRFRLVGIETVMMGSLVLIAGLALHQPTMLVLRATALVAASCFATGLLLVVLTGLASRLLTKLWRSR